MGQRPDRQDPGPGRESVWDYPRPPRLEPVSKRLRVDLAGETIAETTAGYRILETSHPPVYYLPPDSVRPGCLIDTSGRSFCEFKGTARYWTLQAGGIRAERAAWSYPAPTEAFLRIRDYLAFYASRVDACWIDDERVQAQSGEFYGGWITADIVGPFKGAPGTLGW